MPHDLTFYTHPMSRGRIARGMLEEVGVTYDVEVISFDGAIKSPEYLAINPMGKVPAIRHGDVVVTEVAAISGDRFSAADVYLGANLNWGMGMMKTIDERPAFVDYASRLTAREAFIRAGALDDAVVAEQGR